MDIAAVIQTICVYAIPVIFAITMHEASHGFVAKLLGDNTAYYMGRVTLNPMPHIDPVGTILLPIGLLILGAIGGGTSFIFGYAKPVPIIPRYFKNPKRDSMLVALAGPGANLVQMLIWALILKLVVLVGIREEFVLLVCQAGIITNLLLMAFNLIPIPPLDGGRVVAGLLPNRLSYEFEKLERYGIFILFALILTNTIGFFVRPFLMFGQWLIGLVL